jgi:hypothetical protein
MTYYCAPGVGWVGWLVDHGSYYLTNGAEHDPLLSEEVRKRFGVKSGLVVPIVDSEKDVIARHASLDGLCDPRDRSVVFVAADFSYRGGDADGLHSAIPSSSRNVGQGEDRQRQRPLQSAPQHRRQHRPTKLPSGTFKPIATNSGIC